jgi:hypothetical protein
VVSAALITPLGSLLAIAADWHQAHLLAAELDLELIAWLQAEHGGVSLAHQQVAVALHGGHIAELAAGAILGATIAEAAPNKKGAPCGAPLGLLPDWARLVRVLASDS